MTTVTFELYEPDPGPDPDPARGYLRFVPTKSHTAGNAVTLPIAFTAKLSNGLTSVDITPTGPGWSWQVTYQLLGLVHETHYYLVPDVPTIAHTDLVEVNPDTLDPTATPDPGWYSYVDSIVAGQVGTVQVTTGNEVRPGFGSVLWVGGATQPVNMAENTDIWFKATA